MPVYLNLYWLSYMGAKELVDVQLGSATLN